MKSQVQDTELWLGFPATITKEFPSKPEVQYASSLCSRVHNHKYADQNVQF